MQFVCTLQDIRLTKNVEMSLHFRVASCSQYGTQLGHVIVIILVLSLSPSHTSTYTLGLLQCVLCTCMYIVKRGVVVPKVQTVYV